MTSNRAAAMQKYPFKFLDAYTREDSEFFFGREAEIEQLYEMIFQTDLLLVYGFSGTGKTSLIQCGLASKFQSHDWLALNIRRGGNLNASFEKALQDAGGSAEADDAPDWLDEDWSGSPQSPAPRQDSPLARRFKAVYLRHFKPLYLIFDQFEELYILGDRAEQDQFVQTVREILRVEQPVKIILSIREEYLGYLYDFERAVPELLRKKLRVEPMNLDKVNTVIRGVGSRNTSNVRLQSGEEDAIAQGIFDKIRGDEKTLSIQLPYLQVFLDKLYLQITHDETRQTAATFTRAALDQMGGIGDVLRDFLDEQVLLIARQLDQKTDTLWQILSPFVTLDGTKEPLTADEHQARFSSLPAALVSDVLQAFAQKRILRYTEKDERYEIAHDSLARQIHAKRSDEEIALLEVQRLIKGQALMKAEARALFTEKQLDFIGYLSKFNLLTAEKDLIEESRRAVEAEKKRKRWQRNGLIAAVILIILALSGLAAWALQQQVAKEALMLSAMLSAILVVAYFAWKGFIASIDPLPPPEKTKDAKCTQCGVTIPTGEDLCFHCEIIAYRKAKKEKREKAKQDK
ncbi:MAG: ATP-binding protein [Bacteroidia bacterium]|nr:ATP-binding protein [Bacteroidia bacterium]